jgi:geranylgeranyl reductase family protein
VSAASHAAWWDVLVVGGGPAGSTAAHRLARAGVRVTVVEKAHLPRYKTCGGGVVARAIRSLPAEVRDVFERNCQGAELFVSGTDLRFSTRRAEPMIAMTMRAEFDFRLLTAALEAGARVQADCEVMDVIPRSDGVEVKTSGGLLRAAFLIAGDGALSLVARKAGWSEPPALAPALECEVHVAPKAFGRFAQAARFDVGAVPRGYGWVFPKKEHLSIGVLAMRRGRIDLPAMFERYAKLIGLGEIRRLERHGFVIPVRPRREGFVKGRVLLTGDAAGLAEPVTGEGITFALQSGHLAAQALFEGGFEEEGVRRAYERALALSILPELRWGRWLATLTYEWPRLYRRLARFNGARFAETLTDVFTGRTTYRELFRNPRSYIEALRPAAEPAR